GAGARGLGTRGAGTGPGLTPVVGWLFQRRSRRFRHTSRAPSYDDVSYTGPGDRSRSSRAPHRRGARPGKGRWSERVRLVPHPALTRVSRPPTPPVPPPRAAPPRGRTPRPPGPPPATPATP